MTSQFGAAKNPPWARPPADFINANTATSMTQNQLTQAQQLGNAIMVPGNLGNPTIYSLSSNNPSLGTPQYNTAINAVGLQQQQQTATLPPPQAVLPQPGIATPTSLASHQVPTVSYPAPRVSLPQGVKQRVFTGTVTKLHDTFGFVDEEVFFQISSVKGNQPKVGERVLVEAAFNASMPFKWNATRIQLLPGQQPTPVNVQTNIKPNIGMNQILHTPINSSNTPGQMSMNAVPPPPLMSQISQHSQADFRGGVISNQLQSSRINPCNQAAHRTEPSRFSSMKEREKHAAERERERDRRDRERNRESRRKRSPPPRARSPVRSPPRKRLTRIVPRYIVQIPKISLNMRSANVVMLKSRYSNMYIPSDFCFTNLTWTDAFPLGRFYELGNSCNFHIMHKDVEPLYPNKTSIDPPDVDHSFNAKVMLLSSVSLEEFYHKSCALAEDPTDVQEAFQHPTRLLQFLVGIRGKNEPMAIGGAWSPSLDGEDPNGDPQVLINTAIRTTKALTGIDLSGCTKWYRFAEISYLRPAGSHKGRQTDARVETVVIFMPDVWMCSPSRIEWEDLQSAYSKQLQIKISSPEPKEQGTQEEEEMETEDNVEKKEPTHFSELDPKTMKIVDLRQELEARNLSAKGLKSQLIARLTKTLKGEQEAEEEEMKQEQDKEREKTVDNDVLETNTKEETSKKEQEEEQKRKEKREKAALEKKYVMPEIPSIIVHPHPSAKGGKFDCAVMSLSVLLDYRPEDNKEHSFEVSLFAEMFNEMLMRDFGFQIYVGLVKAPAKKEEKDEKKERDDIKKEKDEIKKEKDDIKKDETRKEIEEPKKDEIKEIKMEKDEVQKEDIKKEREERKKDKDFIKREKEDIEKEDKREEKIKEGEKIKEEIYEDESGEREEDGKKEKDRRDKKREKKKYVTTDPALLLSFIYFDQNHTGYLLDKDLEEILLTVGLQLSRAQIKKIVQRVVPRDTLNYRKLTDSVEGEKKDSAISEQDEAKLVSGNLILLESSKKPLKCDEKEPSISISTPTQVSNSVIMYKGSLLNIDSLVEKLEKSEKNRMKMEKKLQEMEFEMGKVKDDLRESEGNKNKLSTQLKQVKEEVSKVKTVCANAQIENQIFQKVLVDSKDTLTKTLSHICSSLTQENIHSVTRDGNKVGFELTETLSS